MHSDFTNCHCSTSSLFVMHVCIFQKLGNGPVLYAVILVWLMSLPVSVKCVAMSNRLRKWVLFLFIEH